VRGASSNSLFSHSIPCDLAIGMKRIWLWTLAVTLCACMPSQGRWESLPETAQALFDRCARFSLCQEYTRDSMSYEVCIRPERAKYADERTPAMSRRWLLERGCPASVVNPNLYVHDPAVSAPVAAPRAAEPPDPPMKKGNGSTCSRSSECVSDLCMKGACAEPPKLGDGQACRASADCQSDMCIRGVCGVGSKLTE
jgi:hypothetical protein